MRLSKLYKRLFNHLKNIRFKNNKIYLIHDSGKKTLHPTFIPIKGYNIIFHGNNNIVVLHKQKYRKQRYIDLNIRSSSSFIKLGRICSGNFMICTYEGDEVLKIGDNISCCDICISMVGNRLTIGNNCLISNNVRIWADGHSVLDNTTKEVINLPKKASVVGNHVWLGERVTLLKNAVIPDNCIVGIASVVTKEFNEPNCLIAGNPAEVKKHNIDWTGLPPRTYSREHSIK